MYRKICLFTAHSPAGGGGSVILRSLIKNLPEISVSWYYLANKPVGGYEEGYLGRGLMGGAIVKDIWQSWKMLANLSSDPIEKIVEKLLIIDCDVYWIVSHNEGLRIALELTLRQKSRPVHLTVHDDWAGALSSRSVRYRFMAGLAKKLTVLTLRSMSHFDVISEGMQEYYLDISGKKGEVCHRYLPASSLNITPSSKSSLTADVKVGHIGSIYDKADFLLFLKILQQFFNGLQKKVVIHMWGCHLKKTDIPIQVQSSVEFHLELKEKDVIPYLADCDFVYAMYPMGSWAKTFCRTSLPTKLTTYVQAKRPVLVHAPADSTLSGFIQDTSTGVVWSSRATKDGLEALSKIWKLSPNNSAWEFARKKYFGENNLEKIKQLLDV